MTLSAAEVKRSSVVIFAAAADESSLIENDRKCSWRGELEQPSLFRDRELINLIL